MPNFSQPIPALQQIDDDWKELNKPGSKGFLSVIAMLNWWGAQIGLEEQQPDLWHAAVADISWVMEQIIESQSGNGQDNST